jgi:hypothetical protein
MKLIITAATLLLSLPCWAKSPFPVCGVLTKEGYRVHEAKEQFKDKVLDAILVVPKSLNSPIVKRYQVVDNLDLQGYLGGRINWWVCVTKGRIVEEATSPSEINHAEVKYGILQVDAFSADMSNGEHGAE